MIVVSIVIICMYVYALQFSGNLPISIGIDAIPTRLLPRSRMQKQLPNRSCASIMR